MNIILLIIYLHIYFCQYAKEWENTGGRAVLGAVFKIR
jgi:hypothetical protein